MKDARLSCTAFLNLVDEQCRTHFAQLGCTIYLNAVAFATETEDDIQRVQRIILTGEIDCKGQAGILNNIFRRVIFYIGWFKHRSEQLLEWLSFDISMTRMFNLCQCFASVMFSKFKFLSPLTVTDDGDEPSDEVWKNIYDIMDHVDPFLFEIKNDHFKELDIGIGGVPNGVDEDMWTKFKSAAFANHSYTVISFLEVDLFPAPGKRSLLNLTPTLRTSIVEKISKWKEIQTTSVEMNKIALLFLTAACDVFDNSDLSEARKHAIERIRGIKFAELIDLHLQVLIEGAEQANVE